MTPQDLQRLFDYGYWANRKLFQVVATLSPEEFTRNVAGSYGSIRNTLVHMMSAEWGWLDRCGGPPRGLALKSDDYPTFDSVVSTWTQVEGHVRQFLAGLRDEDLDTFVEFTLGTLCGGQRGALLQHAANHSVHHRGQVALLLRVLDHAPGNFDILFYDAEKAQTVAPV